MKRFLASACAFLLVAAGSAQAGPTTEKRDVVAVQAFIIGADEPNPAIVVAGVVAPEGVRCPVAITGVTEAAAVVEMDCDGGRRVRGKTVRLLVLSGRENDAPLTDRCSDRARLKGSGVTLTCEVELPAPASLGATGAFDGKLPRWARAVR